MLLLENGYVQDGLKALVYLAPLVYLVFKRKSLGLKYYWAFFAGLALLFFGNLLDFMDEVAFLRESEFAERYGLLQDFLEDIVGFTLGFIVFCGSVYLEFIKGKCRKIGG
ncbi:MAG: hypothetical protein NG740_07275 [Omnitrophica bacterium]|nr:hypothetical protein [Candidatus Omnitrophota bacterium]